MRNIKERLLYQFLTGVTDGNASSTLRKSTQNFEFAFNGPRLPVLLYMYKKYLDLRLEISFIFTNVISRLIPRSSAYLLYIARQVYYLNNAHAVYYERWHTLESGVKIAA